MYELGWTRMLSLVLGSSTHSFELMLSAFIFGLAFGGLYVRRRIERIHDPVSYVAYVMIAMGALAALTLPAYNLTFDFMAWFLGTSARTANGYAAFNGISQLIAALIMMPATFCAGMTLPLLTQELMRRGTGERAIGTIYSANTLGAIVGVLVTIHVLMPSIGVKGVILGGAGIHMALGLSATARQPASPVTDLGYRPGGMHRSVRDRPVCREFGSCADGVRRLPHRLGSAAGGRPSHLPAGRQDSDDKSRAA